MSDATHRSDGQAYAEETVLYEVLGSPAEVKVLAALLGDHDRDLNASDISRMAGADRATFYEHIDLLRDYGLVELTRTVGQSKMCQINKESEAAKALAEFEWKLIDVEPDER